MHTGANRRPAAYCPDGTRQIRAIREILRRPQLQAKLTVSDPHDAHEQEADRVAEAVMHMPEQSLLRQPIEEEEELLQPKSADREVGYPDLQRQVEEEEEELLQPKRQGGEAAEAGPDLDQAIAANRGGGQPLPEESRSFFEPRMGRDFSDVKVHTGRQAADLTCRVNARAFTLGSHIYFGAGEFAPESSEGKKLLAHELTHVAQQGAMLQMQRKIYRQPRSGRRRSRRARIGARLNSRPARIDQSKSAEYASVRDPHDRALHSLKQRLLERARQRQDN